MWREQFLICRKDDWTEQAKAGASLMSDIRRREFIALRGGGVASPLSRGRTEGFTVIGRIAIRSRRRWARSRKTGVAGAIAVMSMAPRAAIFSRSHRSLA